MRTQMKKSKKRDEEQVVNQISLADLKHPKIARVLIVDDDRTTRRLAAAQLQDYCELIEAPDASQGITAYNAHKPDLVFMDIELPDGDGHDLLDWMMRNDPGAFVVMFSGHSQTDNVIKSAEKGAKGFVSKPFNLNQMLYFIKVCPKLH